jgi:MoaA/NifB/PqqE/SkfB family radical SAM enzyme
MIKAIQLTNLSCNLIKSDLLKNRLAMAKLSSDKLTKTLYQLYYEGLLEINKENDDKNIEKLAELGFLKILEVSELQLNNLSEKAKKEYEHFPLGHIEALNFELTYECNSNCPHCLLKTVRKKFHGKEISFENAKRIIADAYFAGLLQNGINFTGGEALLAKTDIFELIRYASSYGIPTRLFTNSFWGNKYFFKAADQRFSSPMALIKKFKISGLNQLALSFDSRFDKEKTGIKQLITIIQACEAIGLNYELISSPEIKSHLNSFLQYAKITLEINEFKYMTPITMDLVDMGGAVSFEHHYNNDHTLKELISNSQCKGKGFYQPNMITISPNGGVRSCMYGLGLENLGNINNNSLLQIINNFNDHLSSCFAEKKAFELSEIIYEPYKDIYKPFSHNCSACVLLARLIQEYYLIKTEKEPTEEDLFKMNYKVGKDLNLLKESDLIKD